MPCGPVQIKGPPGVAERLSEPLLPFCEPGQAVVNPGLADAVADRLGRGQQVQGQRGGASRGDQASEVIAAGHLGQAAGRAGHDAFMSDAPSQVLGRRPRRALPPGPGELCQVILEWR